MSKSILFLFLSLLSLSFLLTGCATSTAWLDPIENAVAQQENLNLDSTVELNSGPAAQIFKLTQFKKGDSLAKIKMTDSEEIEWLQIHSNDKLWTYESRTNTFTQNLNPDFPGPSDDFGFWFASLRPALKSMKMEEAAGLITLTKKDGITNPWAIYKTLKIWVNEENSWPMKIEATLENGSWTWTATALNLDQSPDDSEFVWTPPKDSKEMPFAEFRLKARQESVPTLEFAKTILNFEIQEPSWLPKGFKQNLIGVANPLPKGVKGPQLISLSYANKNDDTPLWLHQSNSTFFNESLQSPLSGGPKKPVLTKEPTKLLLRWTRDDEVMMGLFSELKDEAELMKIAESVKAKL